MPVRMMPCEPTAPDQIRTTKRLVGRSAVFLLAALASSSLSLISQARASDSATYTYDDHGRIATITYANGTKITYTYDTAGNRQQVVATCSAGGC